MLKLMRKPIPQSVLEGEIRVINELLRESIRPVSAYLFGSSAEGRMTDQSDFDLLVVMKTEDACKNAKRIFFAARKSLPNRPFDVLWFTLDEFNRKKDLGGVAFVAVREGRRLL